MNQAQLNIAALLLQSYGYLSAADLLGYCDPQLIVSRQTIVPDAVQRAVRAALSDIVSKLQNVYDLTQELSKTDTVAPAALATVGGGAITGGNITGAGTNFVGVPIINLTNAPNDPGTGGVLTAVVSPTVVSSLLLFSGGHRYTVPPVISFLGGGGTGAAATCTLDSWGHVNALQLISGGTGWTSIPQIVFTAVNNIGFGASAVAMLTYGQLTDIEITTPGTGYVVAPLISFSGGQAAQSRNDKLVSIASAWAVRKLMSGGQNISEVMEKNFKFADAQCEEMRGGLDGLPLFSAARQIRSNAILIQDNFRQRG